MLPGLPISVVHVSETALYEMVERVFTRATTVQPNKGCRVEQSATHTPQSLDNAKDAKDSESANEEIVKPRSPFGLPSVIKIMGHFISVIEKCGAQDSSGSFALPSRSKSQGPNSPMAVVGGTGTALGVAAMMESNSENGDSKALVELIISLKAVRLVLCSGGCFSNSQELCYR